MKLQKARKDHICDECKIKIPKGHKYWNDYDQDAGASRTHVNCELYRNEHTAKALISNP